jgi:nicotinamide riboside kinase
MLAIAQASAPTVFFDTDLFTTLGYWEIMGYSEPPEKLVKDAAALKSDVYYLFPDDIPFELDPLRYGGDARESTRDFWKNLLIDHGLNFVEVPSGSKVEKLKFIENYIKRNKLCNDGIIWRFTSYFQALSSP